VPASPATDGVDDLTGRFRIATCLPTYWLKKNIAWTFRLTLCQPRRVLRRRPQVAPAFDQTSMCQALRHAVDQRWNAVGDGESLVTVTSMPRARGATSLGSSSTLRAVMATGRPCRRAPRPSADRARAGHR
jgi:hypothetical protein